MTVGPPFAIVEGDGPIVATAIHDGHALREEIAAAIALADDARLREEDPFTGRVATLAPTHAIVDRSRFEVDLNRPRDRAVYRVPADAWGLDVWHAALPAGMVARSLAVYDAFYAALEDTLRRVERRHGRFVVLDIHSYNHRRAGAGGPVTDAAEAPVINLGTESVDRARWGGLVDGFCRDVAARGIDIRENVAFRGGHLVRWVHRTFPETGCGLAIELKKMFMDEWSGALEASRLDELRAAIASAVPGLEAALARLSA